MVSNRNGNPVGVAPKCSSRVWKTCSFVVINVCFHENFMIDSRSSRKKGGKMDEKSRGKVRGERSEPYEWMFHRIHKGNLL